MEIHQPGETLDPSDFVASINSLTGAVVLAAGTNINLATVGNTITINGSASGVTSVSGTTNRITSTGGTTPVIDISANYNATLAAAYRDTEYNILAITPTAGLIAWATDLGQLMVANGTNWYINSSYLAKDLQNPDMGYLQGSNRAGYGLTYVTDKTISNSSIGANSNTAVGGIRYNATGLNNTPSVQLYFNSTWNNIVAGLNIQEVNAVLEHTPVGYTQRIAIFSGNSDLLGLNGLPIIQGYVVSMGAYPAPPQVDGGTF